jgi:plastocyanin
MEDLVAQRSQGYFQPGTGLYNGGTLQMGMEIIGGVCDPYNIPILPGDTVYFENTDPLAHTIEIYNGAVLVTTLNLPAFTDAVQPITPANYPAVSYLFAAGGTYDVYVDGMPGGIDGTVSVLGNPIVTAIVNDLGSNYDDTTGAVDLIFTITGTDFWVNPLVAPEVTLTDETPGSVIPPYTVNADTWDATTTTGTITGLLPGKYSVQITYPDVTINSTSDVNNTAAYYYKGAGDYEITVTGKNKKK